MNINYKGAFIQKLEQAIEDNPTMTIGEILTESLHKSVLGKHFFYCSDSEIYTAFENFAKNGKETDEDMTEEEVETWINKK